MSCTTELQAKYGAGVAALSNALHTGTDAEFLVALGQLTMTRDSDLAAELKELTTNLRQALDRFSLDSRIADLAEKEVPDARHRLDHVLKLTDEAAHTTLDLVERSGPLAERTAKCAADLLPLWAKYRSDSLAPQDIERMLASIDAFLPAARADSDQVRSNLAEVLLAQGYQDISGQIIRGVTALVTEIEHALVEFVRLSAGEAPAPRAAPATGSRGHGPVVPGVSHGRVVSDQEDVDALLSGLGM